MTLSQYLILLAICAGLCWLGWGVIIFTMGPHQGWWPILLFYLSIGLSFLATFSCLGLLIRAKLMPNELPSRQVKAASRHAILLTIFFLLALILQSARWLTWWNLIILIVLAGLSELLLASQRKISG